MAFALTAGDIVAPVVYAALAASSEPPPQGIVTGTGPTIVIWQDGREQQFASDASANVGLGKFVADFNSPLLNKKVRPKTGSANLYKDFSNIDHRAEGIVVLAGAVTNAIVTDLSSAVVRLDNTGLYVLLAADELDVVPGA